MYPNVKITFNISPNALIGKLFIEDKYYRGEVFDGDVDDPALKFEAGKEFSENILTDNIFKLGYNWFGLPSLESVIDGIEKEFPSDDIFPDEEEVTYIDFDGSGK